jgi:hypothetical protein
VRVNEPPAIAVPSTTTDEIVEPASGERPTDYSDVFVCRPATSVPYEAESDEAAEDAATCVTLFVYGWHNVEPGPLSWAFPSLRAALDAVRTMRNAVQWSIVAGRSHLTIDEARQHGTVLIEQLDALPSGQRGQ